MSNVLLLIFYTYLEQISGWTKFFSC